MVRALPYIVPLALALYALIDFSRSTAAERAEIHPAAWVAIIVLLPVVGPVTWILVSRSRRAHDGVRTGSGSGPGTRPTPPASSGGSWPVRRPGPAAPDDDPDFLRRLEQQQRRRRRAPGSPPPTDPPDDTPGPSPETP